MLLRIYRMVQIKVGARCIRSELSGLDIRDQSFQDMSLAQAADGTSDQLPSLTIPF